MKVSLIKELLERGLSVEEIESADANFSETQIQTILAICSAKPKNTSGEMFCDLTEDDDEDDDKKPWYRF